jgi:DNA-binding transcriptional MerR regulator
VHVSRDNWKVGELAAERGLTVRTLHHHDEIELFRLSERSEAGHRIYTEADVRRLFRIISLRQLGFPLADITAMIESDDADPARSRASSSRCRRGTDRAATGATRTTWCDPQRSRQLLEIMEVMMQVEKYYIPAA